MGPPLTSYFFWTVPFRLSVRAPPPGVLLHTPSVPTPTRDLVLDRPDQRSRLQQTCTMEAFQQWRVFWKQSDRLLLPVTQSTRNSKKNQGLDQDRSIIRSFQKITDTNGLCIRKEKRRRVGKHRKEDSEGLKGVDGTKQGAVWSCVVGRPRSLVSHKLFLFRHES